MSLEHRNALDLRERNATRGGTSPAACWRLPASVYFTLWDRAPRDGTTDDEIVTPHLGDTAAPPPYLNLTLPTVNGGERVLVAMRAAAGRESCARVTARDSGGNALAEGSVMAAAPEEMCTSLVAGLTGQGCVRLLQWLLSSCGSALRVSRDRDYLALCQALIRTLQPEPPPLGELVAVGDDLVLTVDELPATIGAMSAVAVVGPSWVRMSRVPRARGGRAHLLLERELVEAGNVVVVFGSGGLQVRRVTAGAGGASPAVTWLAGAGHDGPRLVSRVAPAIGAAARRWPALESALWEMQLRAPWPRRQAIATGGPVSADIDLAIGRGAGGLFLAGWFDDPHGMLAGWRVLTVFGSERLADRPMHPIIRAMARDPVPGDAVPRAATRSGFVTYLPGAIDPLPSLQHRIELRLRSGTRIGLVPPLPPASFADARTAVLSSVPLASVTAEVLDECVGPAADSLHASHLEQPRVEGVVTWGAPPRSPDVSIVIALHHPEVDIRATLGALGTDPQCGGSELIFVVDAPERAVAIRRSLCDLSRLHGLAITLVTMREPFGRAAALNAGCEAASGRVLLFLGAGAIPAAPGWLGALRSALKARRGLGIVGAKLLSCDGAVDHAGTYFEVDRAGKWSRHHPFRGLPRRFENVDERRSVPAVSGDCLMIARTLFDRVGRFTESYLGDDLDGTDLCLKARAHRRDVELVPSAELYRIDASPEHAGDLPSRVAGMVDARRFAERWSGAMDACTKALARAGDPTARILVGGGSTRASGRSRRRGR